MNIDKLYFGIKRPDFNTGKMETENIFDSYRVKSSVAMYATMKPEERKKINNPLAFCFGDTWARCEWEMMVADWPTQKNVTKTDVYTMYVEPNADYLVSLVDSVSPSSAQRWLREDRKRRFGK